MARGLLWRGGLPPFGCAAAVNPNNAVCLKNRDRWFWGRYATQRGQAPSPQKAQSLQRRRRLRRIQPIQRPIHRQFPQHDHLRNPQQRMATRPLQMIHQIVGHDIG